MVEESENSQQNSVIFFEKGTKLYVRIKNDTDAPPHESFVEIRLMFDLRIDFFKKSGVLEDCLCEIPALQTTARSVNHAYTIISERFEIRRMAKGGNVFRNVFFVDATNGRVPLGQRRELLRVQRERNQRGHAVYGESQDEPSVNAAFDVSTISFVLNGLLYDSPLFAELACSTTEKCFAAANSPKHFYEEDPGRLFPLYHHIFAIFRGCLGRMAIGDLMEGWAGNVQPFLRGAWSGFYQNEVDWLLTSDTCFAQMVVELMNSRNPEEDQAGLYDWIRRHTEKVRSVQSMLHHEPCLNDGPLT